MIEDAPAGQPPPDASAGRWALAPAACVAGVGWWLTGSATVVPVVLVGALALVAALVDAATGRIPNELVVAGGCVVVASWALVAAGDGRSPGGLTVDVLLGCALGGGPVSFAVWCLAPHLIGGGDWKLLTVCGAALGYLAPASSVLLVAATAAGALAMALARRCRRVPLAPSIMVGYSLAAVVGAAAPHLFGGGFR